MADISLPEQLHLRPQRDGDFAFVEGLYKSTRDDLQWLDAEAGFIDELIDMQFRAQREGYGGQFPNAMYFVVEWLDQAIGRVVVDFGSNEVRLVDLALLPAARGKGVGAQVIRSMQLAATKVMAPLTLTVSLNNLRAAQLYVALGFRVEAQTETHALMIWYPMPNQVMA